MDRRTFLNASSAALFGAPALGIEPFERKAAKLQLGLAAISYSAKLNLNKSTMTLFDFLDLAAKLEVENVELTSYYWLDTTAEYAKKLLAHAKNCKLRVSGVPLGNDFCLTDTKKLNAEIERVKMWIELAAVVEAKTLRIFAGKLEKGDTREAASKRVIESIEECCKTAEKTGVMLALENHGGLTDSAESLLALVKPVKSKAFGVNIDTGNFKTKDPYADIAAVMPYGIVCQVKAESFPAGKPSEIADLAKIVKILKAENFQGAVVLEYEAKEDPKTAVPKYLDILRKEIAAG